MRRALFALLALLALAACKAKRDAKRDDLMPEPLARDADAVVDHTDAAADWPELTGYPHTDAVRVIALPVRADAPRFEVGGPALVGDLAIVASSQLGFAAVDWRRGAIAWSKPAGAHVAPPLGKGASAVLVGECVTPPTVADRLLGCLRVVTAAGADEAYTAIHGRGRAIDAFAGATGAQALWIDGDRAIRWRRGDAAITVDLISGVATPASADPPPLEVTYKGRTWCVTHEDGRIVARLGARVAWHTDHAYSALIGVVWMPELSPLLRVANATTFIDSPEIVVHDIDATGSLHATSARPAPGISVLAWATSAIGDAAIAVRLDKTIRRDYIAGYAANAMLRWVYRLPEQPRADPVGVAVAPDAVLVFHDGDTLAVLPELSAPPTAPGAAHAPSQNPTP